MLTKNKKRLEKSSLTKMVDALLVVGNSSSIRDPELTQPIRISLLAAGILRNSGFSNKIVLLSSFPQLTLMKNYLFDIFPNISSKDIISEEKRDDSQNAEDIKAVIRKHSKLKELGIISAGHSFKGQSLFDKVGLCVTSISPDEVLNEAKIAKSLKSPSHVITELIKETILNFIRYRRMLENVTLHRITLL